MTAWGTPSLRPVRRRRPHDSPPSEVVPLLEPGEEMRVMGRGCVVQTSWEGEATLLLTSNHLMWRPVETLTPTQESREWRSYEWPDLRVRGRRGKHAIKLEYHVPHETRTEFVLAAPRGGLNSFVDWVAVFKEVVYLTASWQPISDFDRDLARGDMLRRLTRLLDNDESVLRENYFALMESNGSYALMSTFLTTERFIWFDGTDFVALHLNKLMLGGDSQYQGGLRLTAHVEQGKRLGIVFLEFAAPHKDAIRASMRFNRALKRELRKRAGRADPGVASPTTP